MPPLPSPPNFCDFCDIHAWILLKGRQVRVRRYISIWRAIFRNNNRRGRMYCTDVCVCFLHLSTWLCRRHNETTGHVTSEGGRYYLYCVPDEGIPSVASCGTRRFCFDFEQWILLTSVKWRKFLSHSLSHFCLHNSECISLNIELFLSYDGCVCGSCYLFQKHIFLFLNSVAVQF